MHGSPASRDQRIWYPFLPFEKGAWFVLHLKISYPPLRSGALIGESIRHRSAKLALADAKLRWPRRIVRGPGCPWIRFLWPLELREFHRVRSERIPRFESMLFPTRSNAPSSYVSSNLESRRQYHIGQSSARQSGDFFCLWSTSKGGPTSSWRVRGWIDEFCLRFSDLGLSYRWGMGEVVSYDKWRMVGVGEALDYWWLRWGACPLERVRIYGIFKL